MTGVETLNEARGKLSRKAGQLNARNAGDRGLPPLLLLTDDAREVDWVEAVRALPPGCAVVVRHRQPAGRERLARQVRPICAAGRLKLLVADDAALAVRVGADGVHLPQRRTSKISALKAHYPQWLVTASAHNEAGVLAASRLRADAVLIAPVFATASHPGSQTLGVLRLTALAARARVAAYALGGVDGRTAQQLSATPLCGIALIGGWTSV
jgi:thiamine-phosphate pyrophosphorylase